MAIFGLFLQIVTETNGKLQTGAWSSHKVKARQNLLVHAPIKDQAVRNGEPGRTFKIEESSQQCVGNSIDLDMRAQG